MKIVLVPTEVTAKRPDNPGVDSLLVTSPQSSSTKASTAKTREKTPACDLILSLESTGEKATEPPGRRASLGLESPFLALAEVPSSDSIPLRSATTTENQPIETRKESPGQRQLRGPGRVAAITRHEDRVSFGQADGSDPIVARRGLATPSESADVTIPQEQPAETRGESPGLQRATHSHSRGPCRVAAIAQVARMGPTTPSESSDTIASISPRSFTTTQEQPAETREESPELQRATHPQSRAPGGVAAIAQVARVQSTETRRESPEQRQLRGPGRVAAIAQVARRGLATPSESSDITTTQEQPAETREESPELQRATHSRSRAPCGVAAIAQVARIGLATPSDSSDMIITVGNATDERLNGEYKIAQMETGGHSTYQPSPIRGSPAYQHAVDKQMNIQWSEGTGFWILGDIDSPTAYKVVREPDRIFPCNGIWEVFQGSRLPVPDWISITCSLLTPYEAIGATGP